MQAERRPLLRATGGAACGLGLRRGPAGIRRCSGVRRPGEGRRVRAARPVRGGERTGFSVAARRPAFHPTAKARARARDQSGRPRESSKPGDRRTLLAAVIPRAGKLLSQPHFQKSFPGLDNHWGPRHIIRPLDWLILPNGTSRSRCFELRHQTTRAARCGCNTFKKTNRLGELSLLGGV